MNKGIFKWFVRLAVVGAIAFLGYSTYRVLFGWHYAGTASSLADVPEIGGTLPNLPTLEPVEYAGVFYRPNMYTFELSTKLSPEAFDKLTVLCYLQEESSSPSWTMQSVADSITRIGGAASKFNIHLNHPTYYSGRVKQYPPLRLAIDADGNVLIEVSR